MVRAALAARGYSDVEAAAIVAACGTRLRVLEEPLTYPVPPDVRAYITEQEDAAIGQFRSLLAALSPADAAIAARLLDDIAAAEARGTAPPAFTLVPPSLKAADFTRVIFIKSTGDLTFQSRIHRNMWRQHHKALVAGMGIASACPTP